MCCALSCSLSRQSEVCDCLFKIYRGSGQKKDDARGRKSAARANPEGGYERYLKHFNVHGDGGVITTLDDLARWDANLRTTMEGHSPRSSQSYTRFSRPVYKRP